MSNNLLRDAVLVSLVIGGGIYGFTHRPQIYELIGFHPADVAEARASREAATRPETKVEGVATLQIDGSATSIRKARDGQFWADARVNSTHVKFLVDTGASVVALTPMDAQKAGFNPRQLVYNAPMNTAAGKIMAARIELSIVSVGNVSVRNVRAVVIPDGLPHSLLGMSYLGELQKVEATKDLLILRQ